MPSWPSVVAMYDLCGWRKSQNHVALLLILHLAGGPHDRPFLVIDAVYVVHAGLIHCVIRR